MKPLHVTPVNDLREHITNGDPCPCLPLIDPDSGNIVHNAYDAREVGEVCRRAMDFMAKHLEAGLDWSARERWDFEHAMAVLDMHWPRE